MHSSVHAPPPGIIQNNICFFLPGDRSLPLGKQASQAMRLTKFISSLSPLEFFFQLHSFTTPQLLRHFVPFVRFVRCLIKKAGRLSDLPVKQWQYYQRALPSARQALKYMIRN